MKRPMTLTAGILSTVANAIMSVIMLVGLIAIFEITGEAGVPAGSATLIIVGLLEFAVFIVNLILGIISIACWNKNKDEFKKKKATLIVAASFNFLGAIISFVTGYVFYIILAFIMIAAGVLFIVDVSIENSRVSKNKNGETVTSQKQGASMPADSSEKIQAADEFSQKLAKITALKNSGVLSEEEFSEIKKTYVKEYLGK